MRKVLLCLILLSLSFSYAECVKQFYLKGYMIKELLENKENSYYVEKQGRFVLLNESLSLEVNKSYLIQEIPQVNTREEYLKYYGYQELLDYLQNTKQLFDANGYQLEVIGKSIQGRDMYVIWPQQISAEKKTVVMFCRHHGDEGTANWIVEGFVNTIFQNRDKRWFDEYQLILYPMVNPDGAEAKTRYNSNGKDLNRTWDSDTADEVAIIREHLLNAFLPKVNNVIISLDMHGSFVEDFIYRVPRSFKSEKFFEIQGQFINELGLFDPWQAGNYQLSNGDPGMSRIFLINKYGFNALTHETIRNIPKNNSQGRSIDTLKAQGEAVYKVLFSGS